MKQSMTFMLIDIAAGSERLIIFEKIDLFIADAFGSNANKNDGIPTVRALIRLSCLGLKGREILKNIDKTIRMAE